MESKLIAVEIDKDHPKLMRLPSVSRSLLFSIMPKSCYEMYEKPVILKHEPKIIKLNQAPILSTYRPNRTKSVKSYVSRPIIKPSKSSYVYQKMFNSHPNKNPPILPKRSRSRPNTTQTKPLIMFYCEVNPPKSAPKPASRPRTLNNTLLELGETSLNCVKSSTQHSVTYQNGFMIDREMGIEISVEEDLYNISEVQSSMELSISSQETMRSSNEHSK